MNILGPPTGNLSRSLCAIILALGVNALCFGQFPEQVILDAPFAYWSMNETGPGDVENRALGVTTESASFPETDQLEFGVEGLADPNATAVRFKGFADANNAGFMTMENSSNTNAVGPWLEKTIELWFSADDADTEVEQVLYEQGGSTRGMVMFVRGGQVHVGAHNSNADAQGVASPWPAGRLADQENELAVASTEIESNTPYHLAMVFRGDDAADEDGNLEGTITGYLNGVEFGVADNIGTLYAHTDPIRIGGVAGQAHFDLDFSGQTPFGNDSGFDGDAETPQAPYFFSGVIDDVALYDTALSEERIKAHFDARDYVLGDFDGNGVVELADFAILADNFNQAGTHSNGDITFNGQVNLEDFSVFRRVFAAQGAATAAAVPEPSSRLLVLCIAFALPVLRRRRAR